MKILLKYALTYGSLMLIFLGISFMLNSSPRLRHEQLFPYLDNTVTLCMIIIVVHGAWTVFKNVRLLRAKNVGGRKRGRLVAIVIAVILFIIIAEVTEFGDLTIRHEEVAAEAIMIAEASPLVQSAVGTDIRLSWPITGTFEFNAIQGRADIKLPIIGSKGRGALLVSATKVSGRWYVTNEVVSVGSEYQTLKLLDKQQ